MCSVVPFITYLNLLIMTLYFYKGKKLSHSSFIFLLRQFGLCSGASKSHYEHLLSLASNGNISASFILRDLVVK